jgi:hypothetical protein
MQQSLYISIAMKILTQTSVQQKSTFGKVAQYGNHAMMHYHIHVWQHWSIRQPLSCRIWQPLHSYLHCIRYCITASNHGLYPRIRRGECVSRRAVGPRWHDDFAYTISVDLRHVIFRSEVGNNQHVEDKQ